MFIKYTIEKVFLFFLLFSFKDFINKYITKNFLKKFSFRFFDIKILTKKFGIFLFKLKKKKLIFKKKSLQKNFPTHFIFK
jgi:hypothetical protein